MNIHKKTMLSSFWFVLEVIGIFVIIQIIRIVIGNLDAFYSGIALMLIAGILFLIAFLITKQKNDNHSAKPGTKTIDGILS
ncbi:MAG: hypothetical protein ACHQLA_06135 [Ignavibacteriales bacterium]